MRWNGLEEHAQKFEEQPSDEDEEEDICVRIVSSWPKLSALCQSHSESNTESAALRVLAVASLLMNQHHSTSQQESDLHNAHAGTGDACIFFASDLFGLTTSPSSFGGRSEPIFFASCCA